MQKVPPKMFLSLFNRWKKLNTKFICLYLLLSQFEKIRGKDVSFFLWIVSTPKITTKNFVFGFWFLVTGWCNESNKRQTINDLMAWKRLVLLSYINVFLIKENFVLQLQGKEKKYILSSILFRCTYREKISSQLETYVVK